MLLIERANLPLEHAHRVDRLVELVEKALALLVRILQLADNARNVDLLPCDGPARLAMLFSLCFGIDGRELLFKRRSLFLMLDQRVDAVDRLTYTRLQNLFGDLFFVEDHHFLNVAYTALEIFAKADNLANHNRGARDGLHDAELAALDALCNLNFAFARQQWYGAHLA